MLRKILLVLIVLVIALMAYVRLAPSDPADWHVASDPQGPGDYPRQGGFTAVRQITTTPDGILQAVDQVAMATPRTSRLAGSVEDGMITYITRSAVFGFPDYTTAEITTAIAGEDPLLQINARQRFGVEDLGVNQTRVQDWLSQLGPLIVAP